CRRIESAYALEALLQPVNPAEQVFLTSHPGDLIAQLSVLKKQQRWDRSNVILERETLVLVHIDLGYLDRFRLFLRNLVQKRRDHFAWPTPLGPEIHDDRFVALIDFAIEI